MIDRDRVVSKLDELHGYVGELREVAPPVIEEYRDIATRRACERLLQISVECVIDVCQLLVSGLRLGLPAEETDLFEKLEGARVLQPETIAVLRRMRGCRDILVHEYGRVSDEIVFETIRTCLDDFESFSVEVVGVLGRAGRGSERAAASPSSPPPTPCPRSHRSTIDGWYVAAAEALDLPLATLDRRLARATGPRCAFLLP